MHSDPKIQFRVGWKTIEPEMSFTPKQNILADDGNLVLCAPANLGQVDVLKNLLVGVGGLLFPGIVAVDPATSRSVGSCLSGVLLAAPQSHDGGQHVECPASKVEAGLEDWVLLERQVEVV